MQIADDPASQIPKVWLGAKGSWRWWFDWTYQEWALGFTSFVIGGTILTWVLPAGLVAGTCAYALARYCSRVISPETPRFWFWTILVAVGLMMLIVSPNPIAWIKPLWLPLALASSFLIPWKVVGTFGRYVDWNRPIAYWLKVPGQVARGPRESSQVEYDASRLALAGHADEVGDLEPHPVHHITTAKSTSLVVVPPVKPRRIARTDLGLRVGSTYINWRH